MKLHFYFPKERKEISELHNSSTAADAAVTSRRVRGSMKSTLRVYEIPACAGMKCSRVAPARNTRAKLGYVAGLEEPRKLGFIEQKNIASSHYANVYTIKNHTQYKLCVMAGSIVYQSAFEQVE